MNKRTHKSFLGWEGTNIRILVAHLMTKGRISFIVEYAPAEPTDRDSSHSDEIYSQLRQTERY
jgi:hypothetical protein